jgi:hypothetical protein
LTNQPVTNPYNFGKKIFDQIQCYSTVNKYRLLAYREVHSTGKFIQQAQQLQMTDWLREIDDKNIVGAVLFDFSAAFGIIDHSLLLTKTYGFTPPAILWIKSFSFKM